MWFVAFILKLGEIRSAPFGHGCSWTGRESYVKAAFHFSSGDVYTAGEAGTQLKESFLVGKVCKPGNPGAQKWDGGGTDYLLLRSGRVGSLSSSLKPTTALLF